MLVEVFGNVPEGQDRRHWFDVRYLTPEHVRQLDDVAPLHVAHVESQLSQVLVEVFGYEPARQLPLHSVPSKNSGESQLIH